MVTRQRGPVALKSGRNRRYRPVLRSSTSYSRPRGNEPSLGTKAIRSLLIPLFPPLASLSFLCSARPEALRVREGPLVSGGSILDTLCTSPRPPPPSHLRSSGSPISRVSLLERSSPTDQPPSTPTYYPYAFFESNRVNATRIGWSRRACTKGSRSSHFQSGEEGILLEARQRIGE